MITLVKALVYVLFHPFEIVHFTIVRRYADAQKHFIGELYEGNGRDAKMIGVTCDNLPIEAKPNVHYSLCWRQDFLAPLAPDTIRFGAQEPANNEQVRKYIAMRRFCILRFTILNRFVEHILESDYVR